MVMRDLRHLKKSDMPWILHLVHTGACRSKTPSLTADKPKVFDTRLEAGRYAEDRYRQGLRRWRVATRSIAIGILGPILVIGVVGLVVFGNAISWFGGALAGAAIAGWAMLRDTPPRYVEQWRDGAEGERRTEKALRPLERSGLRVVHDVSSSCGNYDHIAVGSGGVFLIETNTLQGKVELRDGVPHLLRLLDPEAKLRFERIRPTALGAAARLKEEIERESGVPIWVQAVVVFWSPFPRGLVEDGRCVFVEGDRLAEWVVNRPAAVGRIAGRVFDTEAGSTSPVAVLSQQERTVSK
jgi:hypothetical protein